MLRRAIIPALFLAAPALAGLENEPTITEGLIAVGIAYEISEVCPSINGRTFRGLSYLLSLKSAARDLGYSNQEIDAFVDDDAEKDRLEAVARDRLARMGARKGDVAAHCAVGQTELAKDSTIGRLLRAK